MDATRGGGARAAVARLRVAVAVLAFDPDPATPPGRSLKMLTVDRGLPSGEVRPAEGLDQAARRVIEEAGLRPPPRGRGHPLQLVGVDDRPGRTRLVTCWYTVTTPFRSVESPGAWTAVGRGARSAIVGSDLTRTAVHRVRRETRFLAGAVRLLDDVFTTDDLLRLHAAVHGRIEGSQRTFRRRVQELRDRGVLRRARGSEAAVIRLRVPRFQSPLGTGGRPPELLRYSGSGGEDERLSSLRSRRGR